MQSLERCRCVPHLGRRCGGGRLRDRGHRQHRRRRLGDLGGLGRSGGRGFGRLTCRGRCGSTVFHGVPRGLTSHDSMTVMTVMTVMGHIASTTG